MQPHYLTGIKPEHLLTSLLNEGSGDGHLFPWGSRWETWERAHMLGACVEESSGTGVSPWRGPVCREL